MESRETTLIGWLVLIGLVSRAGGEGWSLRGEGLVSEEWNLRGEGLVVEPKRGRGMGVVPYLNCLQSWKF